MGPGNANAYPERTRLRTIDRMNQPDTKGPGSFDARYVAFLETIAQLRPRLHRYCARMTGSALDGEDVVQEALFEAYRKLEQFDDSRPLSPWLFRIAHNRCIDFLRKREARTELEAASAGPESTLPVDASIASIDRAVEHLVTALPPKERACVLLKDVFDYNLEEIAELVDSTVGGVKAALSRGRSKLSTAPPLAAPRTPNPNSASVLNLYVERFNRRDWDGVRELIRADARLHVADRFAGKLSESPYFGQYDRMVEPWRMALGVADGDTVVVALYKSGSEWLPRSLVRFDIANDRIIEIVDYAHCPWILPAAVVSLPGWPT
jgi:RNA polymerase sigma-70 factor, ECF subfamily